ncbi:glycosyltransferase family 9 protein [Flavihumibacter profundi]|uniref:glycosyltransferase family 9 protein n=1 Tax=Flavihumibacter profundi TaxID=2716883 RepID=UPI001CC46576|nr:glycosyltransferase family 9 protein [Flavihumibacter profundi]MBZ5856663.1 glycosyltransferase family 9 protein [Flavihumibacter profundi]
MPRFLIIQTAFIGDVVLATGILEKLHQRFPDAAIDFLVRKGNEGLLASHPYLHRLLIWDKKAGKYKDLMRLLNEIRSARYDKVINVQRFGATGLLTAFSGAKETIGYDKNPFSRFFTKVVPHTISNATHPKHEIERCNDLIAHFTDQEPFPPHLYPSAADEQKIASFTKYPFLVIAPASVWFTKQYPAEKWVAFLKRIPKYLQVYIIGAPSDEALAQSIISAAGNKLVQSLCGQLSFLQSAALMKKAVMNYVNDSAPMHFASAVNAPTAAIYCSTLPSFGFGPLATRSAIIEIAEPLPCRPCGLHGLKACPEGHFKCALLIREEQLLEQLH